MTSLWTSEEIASAVKGHAGSSQVCSGLAKDSRELSPGQAFIALKGPKTDGHEHVLNALEAGAVAAIVDHVPEGVPADKCLLVEDTFCALQNLARAARARTRAKVIAVTGSVGKTGSKENLAFLLNRQAKAQASERSFNNHWGVPYTLVNHDPLCDYLVLEMGMNHAGELSALTKIARPQIALITTVTEMHIEHLGSLEGIADAKAEIFEGMEKGAVAVLNRDIEMFERLASKAQARDLTVLTFGTHEKADFRIKEVEAFSEGQRLTLAYSDKTLSLKIPTLADHWVINAAGILATVFAAGGHVEKAAEDLINLKIPEGRGEIHRISYESGIITLIDESYNAGPTSMRAALSVLGKTALRPNGRRIAILGDMNELGERSKSEHQALREPLERAQVDLVFTTGSKMKDLYDLLPERLRGGHEEDVPALVPLVLSAVKPDDCVLVKGSKGQYAHRGRMYAFVEALLKSGGREASKKACA